MDEFSFYHSIKNLHSFDLKSFFINVSRSYKTHQKVIEKSSKIGIKIKIKRKLKLIEELWVAKSPKLSEAKNEIEIWEVERERTFIFGSQIIL